MILAVEREAKNKGRKEGMNNAQGEGERGRGGIRDDKEREGGGSG